MEMWCPDDIGRDSWDWGGELASTPQTGVEAPRLLKMEPLQIVLLLLLLFRRRVKVCNVYGHKLQQRCTSHRD